jgi:hypothetical protein
MFVLAEFRWTSAQTMSLIHQAAILPIFDMLAPHMAQVPRIRALSCGIHT